MIFHDFPDFRCFFRILELPEVDSPGAFLVSEGVLTLLEGETVGHFHIYIYIYIVVSW